MRCLRRLAAAVAVLLFSAWAGEENLRLSVEELKKLETFEEHSLRKAEAAMEKKSFRQAAAAFGSFILEFPNSKAIPYAMVQKGRCLQLDNKRNEATQTFTEALDFFPNTPYAAAALYYKGQCYWDNGDGEQAIKHWAQLARHAEYSKHFLAAGAIKHVAAQYEKQGKFDEAAAHYRQVAVTFRRSNPEQAREALEKAVALLIRKLDEPALRSLYTEAGTFEERPQKAEDDVAQSQLYWQRLIEGIKKNGTFPADQTQASDRYYQYWAKCLEGKFPAWDWFQVETANLQLAYEKDKAKWIERVDRQFNSGKTDDYARVVAFLGWYVAHDKKLEEYYNKLDFAKMKKGDVIQLMRLLFEAPGREAMARNVFPKIRLEELNDEERLRLAQFLWHRDTKLVRDTCMTMTDKLRGKQTLLRCYYDNRDAKNGIPLCDELAQEADAAKDALFRKGELLRWTNQFEKAIVAYQQSDSPPRSIYEIANCLVALGKTDQAVAQLREIENFFKDHAAQAVWRIANIYKDAKKTDLYAAALTELNNKYPKSSESSDAHRALQALNRKQRGGVDAE